MAKTYWEKLQDPRWQQKRLEVMKAKDFHCECCGTNQITLNVHHKEYFKNYEPWEYHNNQLAVLCKVCHESLHHEVDLYKWIGSFANLDGLDNRQELAFVLAGYIGYSLDHVLKILNIEKSVAIERYYESGVIAKKHLDSLFANNDKEVKNA
jgi:hypothetical protein